MKRHLLTVMPLLVQVIPEVYLSAFLVGSHRTRV